MNPDGKFWAGKSVLVTGHTGFKGAWLAHWLNALGARVSGFALTPDTEPNLFTQSGVATVTDHAVGDMRDLEAVARALHRCEPEIIFHLAAQSLVKRSYAKPVDTFATNVMGTVNLLQAVRTTPSVKAIVVITTDKCYENREWIWAYRENDPLGGRDPYSASKACAELATNAYRASFLADANVMIATARAGNVIAGGDWAEDRIIPDCVRAFLAGRDVRVRNPHAIRPWQHVLEPLLGYLLLAERLYGGVAAAAGAFNFGPAQEDTCSVSDVVQTFGQSWGPKAGWSFDGGQHQHEARFLSLDSAKARAELGWKPRLHLAQTLEWTAEWYRSVASGASALEMTQQQLKDYQSMDRVSR